MRLTVLTPRVLLDESKLSTDEARSKKAIIDKWFDIIAESNAQVEYLLEDEFMREYVKTRSLENPIISTQLKEEDIVFRKAIKNTELSMYSYVSDETLSLWDKRFVRKVNLKRSVPIPVLRQFKDKDTWLQARSDYAVKLHRLRLTEYLRNQEAVLIFRAIRDNMCPSLKDDVRIGDGRLYIEVDLTNGVASTYYGGQWIQPEYVKTILNL